MISTNEYTVSVLEEHKLKLENKLSLEIAESIELQNKIKIIDNSSKETMEFIDELNFAILVIGKE